VNVYFDCEFSDLIGIKHDPCLISIGLIASSGKELYIELSDTWDKRTCSDFVIAAVLPVFQGGEYSMPETDCAARLKAWIEGFDEKVSLYSDAPNYDWPWLSEMFDRYGWPENLTRQCRHACIFESDTERFRYNNAVADYWRTSKPLGAVQHHALWDARCIRFSHRYSQRKRI